MYLCRCMHVCMQQGRRAKKVNPVLLADFAREIESNGRSSSIAFLNLFLSRAYPLPAVRSCLWISLPTPSPPWMLNVRCWTAGGEGRDVSVSHGDGKEPWNYPVRSFRVRGPWFLRDPRSGLPLLLCTHRVRPGSLLRRWYLFCVEWNCYAP